MRDLKNLVRRKRFDLSFLRRWRGSSRNSFQGLRENRSRKRYLRVLLPVIAVCFAAYPVYSLISTDEHAEIASRKAKYLPPLDPYLSLRVCGEALPRAAEVGGKMISVLPDGGSVEYTIDPELQQRVSEVMAKNKVPFGVFVAVQPKTGRVLAISGHSAIDPSWTSRCWSDLYPMASLFKIVTAAAAFEQKKIEPESTIAFRGGFCSENPRYWEVRGRGDQQVTLSYAMGKSINPVFGRIASEFVGKDSMMAMASRFGFNQTLFPNTPVMPSIAMPPQDDFRLQRMGAGLGEVNVSPLHMAAIMGAIANDGVMMLPVLAEKVTNGKGETVFSENSLPIRRLLDAETVLRVEKSLALTVKTGTSRRAFMDRRGRPLLGSLDVAAKTGSITGRDPQGHYSWFAAYAPVEDPEIALVALVINRDKWKIKASQLGEQALEAYFR